MEVRKTRVPSAIVSFLLQHLNYGQFRGTSFFNHMPYLHVQAGFSLSKVLNLLYARMFQEFRTEYVVLSFLCFRRECQLSFPLQLPRSFHHVDKIAIAINRGTDSTVVVQEFLMRDLQRNMGQILMFVPNDQTSCFIGDDDGSIFEILGQNNTFTSRQ